MTNKKLFNYSINNFIISNENLEFQNTDIITIFNDLYADYIEKIQLGDKTILFKFY